MSTQDPTPPSDRPADRPYGQPPEAPRYGEQPPAPQYGGTPHAGGASPYGEPGGAAPRNGVGLAALIVGIVALVLSWFPGAGFLGIVAVILGIVGLSRVRKRVATNRGASLTGIILGALATVIAIIVLVFTIFVFQQVGPAIADCSQLEPGPEQQQCVEDSLSGAQ